MKELVHYITFITFERLFLLFLAEQSMVMVIFVAAVSTTVSTTVMGMLVAVTVTVTVMMMVSEETEEGRRID